MRWCALRRNLETFEEAMKAPPELPAHGQASLAHLIRPAKNPRIIYELRPHLAIRSYHDSWVETDERGFRIMGPAPRDPRQAFRIVGLGDSFMFGQGVSQGEPYLAVLGEILRRWSAARSWAIINTAVPGYNTVMEVATIEEKGLAHQPHLVILEIVGNDLSLPNFIRSQEPVLSLRRSFLAELVLQRWALVPKPAESPSAERIPHPLGHLGLVPAPKKTDSKRFEDNPLAVPPQYADMVGWDAVATAMDDLGRLQKEHGFTVLCISLSPDGRFKAVALDLARRLGFYTLDVGQAASEYLRANGIERYRDSPLALGPQDGHPSTLYHRMAAEELFRYLEQHRLLPTAAAP